MDLATVVEQGSTPVLGAEREYRAHLEGGGVRWDPREIWPTLDAGIHLDPGDPGSRRGAWGGVLTLDGLDLEVVTPPEPWGPGCVRRVHDHLVHGRTALDTVLDQVSVPVTLTGYSTHVSVEIPDDRVVAVARTVVSRYAPVLMVAFDRIDSPGMLFRPRRGRLEVCGEFLAGRQLRTATTLTLAVALLAERSVRHRWSGRSVSRLTVRDEPAVERYGWYVDRTAFGPDLYLAPRTAQISRRGLLGRGGTTTVGELLARIWELGRPFAEPWSSTEDLHAVDRLVDGFDPLPSEQAVLHDDAPRHSAPERSYGERVLADGTEVTVEAATWNAALLRIDTTTGPRWVTIPGRTLDAFLSALDSPSTHAELLEWCRSEDAGGHPSRR